MRCTEKIKDLQAYIMFGMRRIHGSEGEAWGGCRARVPVDAGQRIARCTLVSSGWS